MAPGGVGDRTGTVPKSRARNTTAHPAHLERDAMINGIPNNLGSKDWQPVRDTQLLHPKKRGNVEAGFLDLLEQPTTSNTTSLDSSPASTRGPQRHHTPGSFPRTRFTSSVPVQQRRAMENLRQKMTFSDVDESNPESEVIDVSSKKQDGAACTGSHRQNAPLATRNRNLSDASNTSSVQNASTKNNTSKLDCEKIMSRLTQIREYIKQTTTIMDGLKNAGDTQSMAQYHKLTRMRSDLMDSEQKLQTLMNNFKRGSGKDVREHLTRFTHLHDVLTTQEQEYVTLLCAVMNLVEESQAMMNGSGQNVDHVAARKAGSNNHNIVANLADQSEESSEEVESGSSEAATKRNQLVQKIIESQEKLKALQDQQSMLRSLQQKAQSRLDAVKALAEEGDSNAMSAVGQETEIAPGLIQDDLELLQQRMNALQDVTTNRNMLAHILNDDVENPGDQQELQQKLQDMQRKKKEMDDLINELKQSTSNPERDWKNEETDKPIPLTPSYEWTRLTQQNAQDILQAVGNSEQRTELNVVKTRLEQLEGILASLDINPESQEQGGTAGVSVKEVTGSAVGNIKEEAVRSLDTEASGVCPYKKVTSTPVSRYDSGSSVSVKRQVPPLQCSNSRQQLASVLSNRIQEMESLSWTRRREVESQLYNRHHEVNSLQAEHDKLMAVQQQLMKLRQDFPINQATENEKDDHKDAAKDSVIKHEVKTGASNQDMWCEMQQRLMLQEELRNKRRQLEALMKKDQGQLNICNHDNRSDISGDKSEAIGHSLLEGTTNATWGGSTEETLEDFGEQDNDVQENSDVYSSDEAEDGREDAYRESYQEQRFTAIQREHNECTGTANRECTNYPLDSGHVPVSTQAKNHTGQPTAANTVRPKQESAGPRNVWGKKTKGGDTLPKAAWIPVSSVHARQENLRTADELVSENDGGTGYIPQNITTWQQLQKQLEGTISLCQSMILEQSQLPLGMPPVGVSSGSGTGVSTSSVGPPSSSRSVSLPFPDMLSMYNNQLHQQQMLLILNQCYQLLWFQQQETNSLQQAVQRLVQEKITGEEISSCSNLNLFNQEPSLPEGDGQSWPAGSSTHTQSYSPYPQVQQQQHPQSQLKSNPHPNLPHLAQSQSFAHTLHRPQPHQLKQSQSTGTFPPYFSHNFLQTGVTTASSLPTLFPSTQPITTTSTCPAAVHPVLNVTKPTRPSDSSAAHNSQQVANTEHWNPSSMTASSGAPSNLTSANIGSIPTSISTGNPSTATTTATLNNQVPPGTRANNYWDNFRSYSRQNLLSSTHKANDSISSSQAQSPLLGGLHGRQGSLHNSQNTQMPSDSDVTRSSVRHVPKLDLDSILVQSKQKKQKINKEQQTQHTNPDNRTRVSSTQRPGLSAGISGTAFSGSTGASSTASSFASLKTPSICSQIPARGTQSQEKELPSNFDAPNENVAFETLRESIYSEIATLISQNECRPYFLIELFRELQMLSSDYLRQRVLFSIQELVGRYLTEDSASQGSPRNRPHQLDASCWTVTTGSEQTPSESMVTSDDEEGRSGTRSEQQKSRSVKNLTSRFSVPQDIPSGHISQLDFTEMTENESFIAVTPSSGSEQPFASDSLGETVIHLDRAVQQLREHSGHRQMTIEGSGPANFQVTPPTSQPQGLPKNVMKNKNLSPGNQNIPAELISLSADGNISGITAAAVDTTAGNVAGRELDTSVQSILVELLPFLKAHLDDVCTPQLLASIRGLVLQLSHAGVRGVSQIHSANIQQRGSKLFHKQLDAVLMDSLKKFQGKRLTEVGEDMLVCISEVLFSELAFLRLVETVGGVQRDRLRNTVLHPMSGEQSSIHNDTPSVEIDEATGINNPSFNSSGMDEEPELQPITVGKLQQDYMTEERIQQNLSSGKFENAASDCTVNRNERLFCDLGSASAPSLPSHMRLQDNEDFQIIMAAEPEHHRISPDPEQVETVGARHLPANLERNFGSYDGDVEGEVPECNGDLAEADQSRESRDLEQDTEQSQDELEPEGSLLQGPEGEPEHQDSHAEGAFSAQNSQAEGINGLGDSMSSEEAEVELNRVEELGVAGAAYVHISGEIPLCAVEQVEQDRELGLDEVPTKLSPPELAQHQVEEQQHSSSMVEELLSAAESELARDPLEVIHLESH